MSERISVPETLSSEVFGPLTLDRDGIGPNKEHIQGYIFLCTFEGSVARLEDEAIRIALPLKCPGSFATASKELLHRVLRSGERVFLKLMSQPTSEFLQTYSKEIRELAQQWGFDEEEWEEKDLYAGWELTDFVMFKDLFRAVYFGNDVFPSLDLVMEIDETGKSLKVHFDG